jgi:hypothetical protein
MKPEQGWVYLKGLLATYLSWPEKIMMLAFVAAIALVVLGQEPGLKTNGVLASRLATPSSVLTATPGK